MAPAPAPAPAAPVGPADPHGFVAAAGRLSNPARKAARIPATVAAALLHDGETVELMVVGRVLGLDAVAVLTDQRLLLVNDNALKPSVQGFEVDPELQVQGWEEGRTASLLLNRGQDGGRIDSIGDTGLAREMAGRIRARTGADAGAPPGALPA
jgi:hypothetical protein